MGVEELSGAEVLGEVGGEGGVDIVEEIETCVVDGELDGAGGG